MSKLRWLYIVMMTAAGVSPAQASEDFSANVTINVVTQAAPCEINNNQNIDVDFGDEVAVTDVAVGLVEKNIVYDLDCSSADTRKTLKMTIQGTGADFDTGVLKTSIAELGVKIKANGADYPLNTAFSFSNANSKPTLQAVLVQKTGSRLTTGAFTAGATMKVDYQ